MVVFPQDPTHKEVQMSSATQYQFIDKVIVGMCIVVESPVMVAVWQQGVLL
jgi:hypothetical protein